jgi:hypothetical protein
LGSGIYGVTVVCPKGGFLSIAENKKQCAALGPRTGGPTGRPRSSQPWFRAAHVAAPGAINTCSWGRNSALALASPNSHERVLAASSAKFGGGFGGDFLCPRSERYTAENRKRCAALKPGPLWFSGEKVDPATTDTLTVVKGGRPLITPRGAVVLAGAQFPRSFF